MDRVLKATAGSATATFYQDGTVVDPGTVTVTITRDDGTVVVSNAATTGTGAQARAYTLSATVTASLDVLTLAWTSPTLGTITTQVEVVGGFICGLADIDSVLNKGGTATAYSAAVKSAARAVATDAFERVCNVAFTPRYARDTFDGDGTVDLVLPTPRPTAVRAVTQDGIVVAAPDLALISVDTRKGLLYRAAGWSSGRRNITVTWEHGWVLPPADLARAVTLVAASVIKDGPFDDRGYGVTDDGGFVRLLTAGVAGAMFSIPDAQAVIPRYRMVDYG